MRQTVATCPGLVQLVVSKQPPIIVVNIEVELWLSTWLTSITKPEADVIHGRVHVSFVKQNIFLLS